MRCHCLIKSGKRCSNYAVKRTKYCNLHTNCTSSIMEEEDEYNYGDLLGQFQSVSLMETKEGIEVDLEELFDKINKVEQIQGVSMTETKEDLEYMFSQINISSSGFSSQPFEKSFMSSNNSKKLVIQISSITEYEFNHIIRPIEILAQKLSKKYPNHVNFVLQNQNIMIITIRYNNSFYEFKFII